MSKAMEAAGILADGYDAVLDRLVYLAHPRPNMSVLDIGCGSGDLTARFANKQCKVWGVDNSAQALSLARKRLPSVAFVQANLRRGVPAGLPQQYDRIVSAFALHHLDFATRLELLLELVEKHLAPRGRLLIAGISVGDASARTQARRHWREQGVEETRIWVADETLMALEVSEHPAAYEQITPLGGIYMLPPR